MLNDKSFLKRTLVITIPIVLQNLLNNLLNLIDTMMIGKLGDNAIAAVGLSNKVFFVFSLLMFGVCSGSGILVAQYWGRRELLNIRRVLRIALIIGVSCSILFVIPGIFFPEFVMRIFTPKEATIALGAEYLIIIAISYPLTAVTNTYVAILRGMNYVKLPVVITTIAIAVNVILNYGLIFGKLGLPEMGVAGAALATVIARVVECAVLMIILHKHKVGDGAVGDFVHLKVPKRMKKRQKALLSNEPMVSDGVGDGLPMLHKRFVMKYLQTALPVICNEFMWGLGVTMYSLVYGRMSETAMAAITITSTVEQTALVFFFGICAASAVILGNELGDNRLKEAEEHARTYIFIQAIITCIGAVLVFLSKDLVLLLFQGTSVEVAEAVRLCIIVFSIFIPARMLNCLFIIAILRAGGDTKAALFLDVSSVWLIGIPMAVLGGLVLKLPIHIVFAMISINDVYKLIFGYLRYRKKKWLRNII